MPILRVTKNGEHLCTIGSDDVWMFSANLTGDIWGPEASALEISGGSKHSPDQDSDFLMWEISHELLTSDRLGFYFEEGSGSEPKGALFDPNAYAEDEEDDEMSFPPSDEDLKKLEARPDDNVALTWLVTLNGGPVMKVSPDHTRQHVSLLLFWNEEDSQQLRLKLSKTSLREIATHDAGKEILMEHLPLGSSLEVVVGGLIRIEV